MLAFVVTRLIRSACGNEAWEESNIGLIYSPKDKKNVGKSLTQEILAKAQGVPSRQHPLLVSGGNQTTAGTSDKKILETLSNSSLVTMVDDPNISTQLGEFLNQVQSGLVQGSVGSGLLAPKGSLLISANDKEAQRVYGRVIRVEYVKDDLAAIESDLHDAAEQELKDLVEANKGILIAWTTKYLSLWNSVCESQLHELRAIIKAAVPHQHPRWWKGVAQTLLTYCLINTTVGYETDLHESVTYLSDCNMQESTQENSRFSFPLIKRVEQHLYTLIKGDQLPSKVLTFLNPRTLVDGEPAVAIGASTVDAMHNVQATELKSLAGAANWKVTTNFVREGADAATLSVISNRTGNKDKITTGRAVKLKSSLFSKEFMEWVKYATEKSGVMPEEYAPLAFEDHPENATNVEELDNMIASFKETLAKYAKNKFKEFGHVNQSKGSATTAFESLLDELSPNTKQQVLNYTPRKRMAFKHGVESAPKLKKGNDLCTSDTSERTVCAATSDETPVPETRKSQRSKRQLFNQPYAEGTVGVSKAKGPPAKQSKVNKTCKAPKKGKKRGGRQKKR